MSVVQYPSLVPYQEAAERTCCASSTSLDGLRILHRRTRVTRLSHRPNQARRQIARDSYESPNPGRVSPLPKQQVETNQVGLAIDYWVNLGIKRFDEIAVTLVDYAALHFQCRGQFAAIDTKLVR